MHLFTDSKVALREAVTRKSARLSPWELIAGGNGDHTQKELLIAKLVRSSNGHKKVQQRSLVEQARSKTARLNGHTKGPIKRDDRGHEVPGPER
jgi:hypothetical protein